MRLFVASERPGEDDEFRASHTANRGSETVEVGRLAEDAKECFHVSRIALSVGVVVRIR